MKRLYPEVGRNLVTNVEPYVVGAAQTLRRAIGTLAQPFFGRKSLVTRFVRLIEICGGLGAIAVIHLIPRRWRRVVLWVQPNIGEFCIAPHYLLRWLERQPELDSKQYVLLTSFCDNRTLLNMARRKVRVIESKFLYEWFRPPLNTPWAGRFWGYWGPIGDYDDSPPHLSFTPGEIKEGEHLLDKMGLKGDRPYVCVHWRDATFHAQAGREEERHSTLRNTKMEAMLPTLRYLAEAGFGVVRMGAVVQEPLPESFCRSFPAVIDYAKLHRSDLGDMFVPSRCKLFVGSSSGLFLTAPMFNHPVVLLDLQLPQFLNHVTGRAVVIFKKYRFQDTRQFVTYKELMTRFPWFFDDNRLRSVGIEALPNTADEILAAVREGVELLAGIDRSTDEDRALQQRFWDMFPPEAIQGHRFPRVGRDFLRENQNLLG